MDGPKFQREQIRCFGACDTGAELWRDLEMLAAIASPAHHRLADAAATELDHRQRKAARHQIDRIHHQLGRIDEAMLPEKKLHVGPSATHDILELHAQGVAGA
jgi:mevalonate pyrophosphate decarboxylase